MSLTEDIIDPALNRISTYTDASVTIPPNTYFSSLWLSPQHLQADWPVKSWDDANAETWQPLIELKPDLIIIGTGKTLIFPEESVIAPLIAAGIGIECMNNASACRTYMILLSEDRPIILAVMLP